MTTSNWAETFDFKDFSNFWDFLEVIVIMLKWAEEFEFDDYSHFRDFLRGNYD